MRILRTFLIALAITTCTAASAGIDRWPQYQGNLYHDGFVPQWFNWTQFQLRWTKALTETDPMAAVGGQGKVFYNHAETMYAVDEVTGTQAWSFAPSGGAYMNPPAYGWGRVYFVNMGHQDTRFTSLNAVTGAIQFREPFDAQWNMALAPTLLNGRAYFHGGTYGGMYAYDGMTGARKWFRELAQYDGWTPSMYGPYAMAYMGSNTIGDGRAGLQVLSATSGAFLFRIPDLSHSWSGWSDWQAPCITKSNHAIVTNGSRLICFNIAQRRIDWEISHFYKGQVCAAAGKVYVVDDLAISCRNEATGALIWNWWWPAGTVIYPPGITHNLLFCSTNQSTYAYNIHTGQLVWSYPKGGQLSILEKTLIIRGRDHITAIRTGI